jgi:pimeloyl-ACP methyl ester carboxylesterase
MASGSPQGNGGTSRPPEEYDRSTVRVVRRALKWGGIVLLVLLAVVLALTLWPASTSGLASSPKPVTSYQRAMDELAAIRSEERGIVIEPCLSRSYTHGDKTDNAVVLVHGLTNCPKQWELFAREIFDRGWNVLVLRLPDHGLGDPETGKIGSVSNLEHLNARKLARYADRAVDLGRGLGERTHVMGLSLGGTIAAWMAQERRDVADAVVIAPGIGLPSGPYALTWGVTNLFTHIPDLSIGHGGKLNHEYQGWSTGGIADTFLLGKFVRQQSSETAPAAAAIRVLLNPNDNTISNPRAEELVDAWRAHGHEVRLAWLPKTPVLGHDVIDPGQPWAQPELVYRRLMHLLGARAS